MRAAAPPIRSRRDSIDVYRALGGVWTALVVIFLMIPIVYVIIHSMNGGNSFNIWKEWGGLTWYRELFDNKSVRNT